MDLSNNFSLQPQPHAYFIDPLQNQVESSPAHSMIQRTPTSFKRKATTRQRVDNKDSPFFRRMGVKYTVTHNNPATDEEDIPFRNSKHSFWSSAEHFKKETNRCKTYNPFEDQNQKTFQVQQYTKGRISPRLINILFTKQYKELNPYILALQEIYNNGDVYPERDRIEELCYIGIGKSVVQYKKATMPPYSRVNLLIREFMVDVADQMVLNKKKKHPERIFLRCNDNAMGFRYNEYDQRLEPYMSKKQYQETIRRINKIIQVHFLEFKKKKEVEISRINRASGLAAGIGLITLIFYILIWTNTPVLGLAWLLILVGVLLSLVGTIVKDRDIKRTSNVVPKIREDIENYLDSVNNKYPKLVWKCGVDFYWIEVLLPENLEIPEEGEERVLAPNPHNTLEVGDLRLDTESNLIQNSSSLNPQLITLRLDTQRS